MESMYQVKNLALPHLHAYCDVSVSYVLSQLHTVQCQKQAVEEGRKKWVKIWEKYGKL